MSIENIKLLIKELETTTAKQCRQKLRIEGENCFCYEGIACELYMREEASPLYVWDREGISPLKSDQWYLFMPIGISEWYSGGGGFDIQSFSLEKEGGDNVRASTLNDLYDWTFLDFANELKEKLALHLAVNNWDEDMNSIDTRTPFEISKQLTYEQLRNLQHTLGISTSIVKKNWGYRNYFACGGDDIPVMKELVALRLMSQGKPYGNDFYYHATTLGKQVALAAAERGMMPI